MIHDAMPEQSDGPMRTFDPAPPAAERDQPAIRARIVGLALVMIAFTAIGMFAYSVYASGAESAAEGRGGASTLVRASTLQAESASPAMTATAPLAETPRGLPNTVPHVDRTAARDRARIGLAPERAAAGRARGTDPQAAVNAGAVKAALPPPNRSSQATRRRYWRAKSAEPDVGF